MRWALFQCADRDAEYFRQFLFPDGFGWYVYDVFCHVPSFSNPLNLRDLVCPCSGQSAFVHQPYFSPSPRCPLPWALSSTGQVQPFLTACWLPGFMRSPCKPVCPVCCASVSFARVLCLPCAGFRGGLSLLVVFQSSVRGFVRGSLFAPCGADGRPFCCSVSLVAGAVGVAGVAAVHDALAVGFAVGDGDVVVAVFAGVEVHLYDMGGFGCG